QRGRYYRASVQEADGGSQPRFQERRTQRERCGEDLGRSAQDCLQTVTPTKACRESGERQGSRVMTDSGQPKRVLFVCHENCNRSQVAEAVARIHGAGLVEPYSAGCRPAHSVSAQAITAMRDLGYDLGQHFPKGLSQVPDVEYDVVVMMSQDRCPGLKAK